MEFPCRLENVQLATQDIALFVPEKKAVKTAYQEGLIPLPHWSQVWPAAKALALFILQHPFYIEEKLVVELGAGLGLPSLVAAHHAAAVFCTDKVPEAVATVQKSILHLHLKNMTAEVLDWQHLPPGIEADVLLLSDINYEPSAFAAMQEVIEFFLQKETTILLSTPQRLMAKDFIALLLGHCTRQEEITVLHDAKNVVITTLVLERKS